MDDERFQKLMDFLNTHHPDGFLQLERVTRNTVSPLNPDQVLQTNTLDSLMVCFDEEPSLITEVRSFMDMVSCYMVMNFNTHDFFDLLIDLIVATRQAHEFQLLSELNAQTTIPELRTFLSNNKWILVFYLIAMTFITMKEQSDET